MKITLRFLSIGCLFTILAVAAIAASPASTKYKVTIRANDPHLLQVEAVFTLADDVITMDENGANQFPERWAKFVKDLKAFDKRGRPFQVVALPDAMWRIDATKGQIVKLIYNVALDHETYNWSSGIDGVAFVRDGGVFCAGRTYLITNGHESGNISVTFDLPHGWHVTNPWQPDHGSKRKYIARGTDELMESMFFAGTHQEFVIHRGSFDLVFALGSQDIAKESGKYESMAKGVMDYYIRLMGGPPKPPPSNPFSRTVVILNDGGQTDGEVIGNNISIILGRNGDDFSKLIAKFMFAHEFFHLWNGKSMRPDSTTEEWFKEGFTNYYALKSLNSIGMVDETDVFNVMNGLFYQRYSTDPLFGKASMRDVASGDEKHKHWGLIYAGGLFAGICADVDIRSATNNASSLDDLMKAFFNRYGGTDSTYSINDIRAEMKRLAGNDLTDLFQQNILGKQPIAIDRCLMRAGLGSSIGSGQLKIARKPHETPEEQATIKGVLGK